ncbi:SDR family oxidoreductase [Marinactinospora thermotolerans]|uniref:Uncharacterized conserved protein YbjT, contains NAD(P)-binding and DUF2867 domains n=1 Tax=Marinactinospora thermotolerans DSM 45154 TaxID=1122192 RepID=A0A1T4R9F2_9ACTN|nr:SDR family oxidoreductase [Marinactinospora thermotolerans]SKA12547.1 Uncharacterized conserved protein YbjT, contains NAD(P)-binding and DUF2867 domains [Marinactinospora thermotolerans DSM 45154]
MTERKRENAPWGRGEILVTGATGTVGRSLVTELVGAGLEPRLLVRPRTRSVVPSGGTVVRADLDDREAVRRAFEGVRALFLLTPLRPRQDLAQIALLRTAVESGVEHVVKVSAFGADPDSPVTVHREHAASDAELSASGLSHAILRPNTFMQNILQWRAGIAGRGRIELPMGDARVSMIDARDIALAAYHALLDPRRGAGIHELTGPVALGYDEIAASVAEVIGSDVRYVEVTPEETAANMRARGVPDWAVQARLELYGSIRAGEAEEVTSGVLRLTGREPGGLPRFLKEVAHLLGRP